MISLSSLYIFFLIFLIIFIGTLVADTHNILLNGGIFGYPSSSGSRQGKIRYLYEALPVSMIIKNAGGMSINENGEELMKNNVYMINNKDTINTIDNIDNNNKEIIEINNNEQEDNEDLEEEEELNSSDLYEPKLHQRIPLYFGSYELINHLSKIMKDNNDI